MEPLSELSLLYPYEAVKIHPGLFRAWACLLNVPLVAQLISLCESNVTVW